MIYDIAVIGGGAAGLAAAIQSKKQNRALNVVVIEALDRAGKKLITTGNGRCNITNRFVDESRYHGDGVSLLSRIFEAFSVDDAVDFFESIGVNIVFEEDGRAYPRSYQASSVVDALRFTAEEIGVEIICGCAVENFDKENIFSIKTSADVINARAVIVACGLLSGGKSVGSDGKMLEILKSKGLKAVKTTPAIVQIKTDTDIVKQLKGIKLNADATLYIGNKKIRQEYGEVLFTDYGLSGPPILQISREASRSKEQSQIILDLFPEYNFNELFELLIKRKGNLLYRTNESFFTGLINKRVGQVILKLCGVKLNDLIADLTDAQLKSITAVLKKFTFNVRGNNGYNSSQVTAGGISAVELNDTLELKKFKGMFLAGEIIDIDGDCGGFNLQWAWSSGIVAADHAVKYLGE